VVRRIQVLLPPADQQVPRPPSDSVALVGVRHRLSGRLLPAGVAVRRQRRRAPAQPPRQHCRPLRVLLRICRRQQRHGLVHAGAGVAAAKVAVKDLAETRAHLHAVQHALGQEAANATPFRHLAPTSSQL